MAPGHVDCQEDILFQKIHGKGRLRITILANARPQLFEKVADGAGVASSYCFIEQPGFDPHPAGDGHDLGRDGIDGPEHQLVQKFHLIPGPGGTEVKDVGRQVL